MSDLISREALLETMCKNCSMQEVCEKSYNETRDFIQNIPAVDAEPVRHGRWSFGEDDIIWWWICSECDAHETSPRRYCPECGAKMMDLEDE